MIKNILVTFKMMVLLLAVTSHQLMASNHRMTAEEREAMFAARERREKLFEAMTAVIEAGGSVQGFITKGADVNASDLNGSTALDYANTEEIKGLILKRRQYLEKHKIKWDRGGGW